VGFGSSGTVSSPGTIRVLTHDAFGRLLIVRTGSLDICRDFREQPCIFELARYLPDGRVDSTFGNAGSTRAQTTNDPIDITVDGQGRILTVEGPLVFRYQEDGREDPSFADHGFNSGKLFIDGVGRILVAGDGIARRQLPDGAGDQSFGRCGVAFEPDVNDNIGGGPGGAILANGTLLTLAASHPGFDPNRLDPVIVGFQLNPGGPSLGAPAWRSSP
jgi:hypothetical protein